MNVIAAFHAYKFTHFIDDDLARTASPQKLTAIQKVSTLIFGVNLPRPRNELTPASAYELILLNSTTTIECWWIPDSQAIGTVILFHGFGGEKSAMLDKAAVFKAQGFNTLLVDFMGSGGSEGNQTTIGFYEAEQVKTCYDYLSEKGEKTIFLFGTSMGAVAIMKAVSDYSIQPNGILLECPFGTMYQTVCARFKMMNAPIFPMAGLLVFWGGLENGFWAYAHNPVDYAKKISCPTLLLYGQQDLKVSRGEIDQVFENLAGEKELKIYANAGHENYLIQYKDEWTQDIAQFLKRTK